MIVPVLAEVALGIITMTGATKIFVPRKYTILVTIFWGILAAIYYTIDPISLILAVAASAGVYTIGNGVKDKKEETVEPVKEYML